MLPNYRDNRIISNVNTIEYDSKMFEFKVRFNKEGVRLERLSIMAVESIGDYRIIGLSKAFRLALEESRQKYLGGVFELVRGAGFSPLGGTTIYAMGKIGVIYDGKADLFGTANIGIITYLSANTKLLTSYEYFWDSNVKYRNFKEQLDVFVAYVPSLSWDINVGLELNFGNDRHLPNETILFGISRYF
jgi:hypothetical protein